MHHFYQLITGSPLVQLSVHPCDVLRLAHDGALLPHDQDRECLSLAFFLSAHANGTHQLKNSCWSVNKLMAIDGKNALHFCFFLSTAHA